MANRTLETLKTYFYERAYPTWQQFHDLLDSFRHKDDKIPITDVDGLANQLNGKASADSLDNYWSKDEELPGNTADAVLNGTSTNPIQNKAVYDGLAGKQDTKQATELYVSQAEKTAWSGKQVLLTKNGLGNFPSSFKLPYACTVKGVTKSDNCTGYSITIAGIVYTTNAILNVNVPANTSIIINDLTATGGVIANAILILTQNA